MHIKFHKNSISIFYYSCLKLCSLCMGNTAHCLQSYRDDGVQIWADLEGS